jgi:hypothetical protein
LGRACRGFRSAKWPGPTQPGPARPGPARPWCPHPPMHPLLLSLSHLDLPRNNLPLPLPPLSPRGALGIGDGDHQNLDPEVSSPPLPFSSLSLSLPFPSLRAPLLLPCARRRPPPPLPARRRPPWPRRGPPALAPSAASPTPGAAPAPARSSLRAASAPCAWRPSSRRDSCGLVYPLTHFPRA